MNRIVVTRIISFARALMGRDISVSFRCSQFNKNTVAAFLLSFVLFAAANVYADFDDLGAGSRARGMGNSFTAIADDAFGIYYNPAGLGFIKTAQLGGDFGKMYFGLDDNSNLLSGFTSVVYPLFRTKNIEQNIRLQIPSMQQVIISSALLSGSSINIATASADANAFSTSKSQIASVLFSAKHVGTLAFGAKYFSLVDYYREFTYSLGYGRLVGERWSWGVSLKYLQENYVMDEYLRLSPVFQYGIKDSVEALSADAGVIVNLLPRLFAGLSILDINQPNTGLKDEDKIPFTGRIGLAWKEKDLCWAVDGMMRNNKWYYSTGIEKYLFNILGLRIGLGAGGQNYFNISGGFSMRFYRTQIDYAFQYPLSGIRDISGNHRMSFIFSFGKLAKDEMAVGSLEYFYAQMQDELIETNQKLTETRIEKENLESILIEESTMRIQAKIKAAKAEARAEASEKEKNRTAAKHTTNQNVVAKQTITDREKKHLVRMGETLQSISAQYYGSASFWDEIYQVNKEKVGRGGVVKPNQVLIIPVLAKSHSSEIKIEKTQMESPTVKVEQGAKTDTKANSEKEVVSEINTVLEVDVESSKVVSPVAKPTPEKKPLPVPVQIKEKSSKLRKHIVQPGEHLRSIAQKYYNDKNKWKTIYYANSDKVVSGQIKPGQELVIP